LAGNTSADACTPVEVKDTSTSESGNVTGGGFLESPAGAYVANPKLTGNVTFEFNAKYLPHQLTSPSGKAQFEFKAADFNFKSTDYALMVITGGSAQIAGTGTINGKGSYRFILSAIDGDLTGRRGDPDRLRIQIFGPRGVIYDNAIDGTPDLTTPISGGSIVIHK
jgi:hypothetical protein